MKIFKISKEDLEKFSSLQEEDIGKYYFILNGCLIGLFETEDAAEHFLDISTSFAWSASI